MDEKRISGILYAARMFSILFFMVFWIFAASTTARRPTSTSTYAPGSNLALLRHAIQSSTFVWEDMQLEAGRAVDGNPFDDYTAGAPGARFCKCSHTNKDLNAWWAVDLGSCKTISQVRLTPRRLLVQRLKDFVVGVTDTKPSPHSPPVWGSYPLCGAYSGVPPAEPSITLNCDESTPAGRYVIVQLPGTQFLEICELEVFEADISPVNGNTESLCPMVWRRDICWQSSRAGFSALGACPNNRQARGSRPAFSARWQCSEVAQWIAEPDLSKCTSPDLYELEREVLESNGSYNASIVRSIASNLSRISTKRVYGGDVTALTFVMNRLVDQVQTQVHNASSDVKNVIRQTSEAILVTTSNILNSEARIDLSPRFWPGLATQLIRAVESSAMQLARTNQSTTNVTSNIVLSVSVYDNSSYSDVTFPEQANLNHTVWNTKGDSISIKADTIQELSINGEARLVFAMYKNVSSWMQPAPTRQNQTGSNEFGECSPETDKKCTVRGVINSIVISATVNEGSAAAMPLRSNITFTLAREITENYENPVCVFWNYTQDFVSDWSPDGCEVLSKNSTHTTCTCNHLTSFAILMSPVHTETLQISHANIWALWWITYIGCGISILCLILCVITFVAFSNLQCDKNTIHKNLCICLLLANVLFLAGIVQYRIPVLCSVIAGFLHYLFLASFAWMCLEGVQLYAMLVKVFEAERSRVAWYYAAGYGCPAIVVGISAAINYRGYGTAFSCWLSVERGFIWAFAGPLLAIIVVNFVVLGIAIQTMIRHANSSAVFNRKEQTNLQQIRMLLRGTIVLVFLLGLTWLFGFLFVNAQTIAFAYIFTILNTLQGMFIYVFHCLLNEKVQTEYKKCIRRASCLPQSFRTRYGGLQKPDTLSTATNSTPEQSANPSLGLFSCLNGNRRRKTSDVNLLINSSTGPKSNQRKQSDISVNAQNPSFSPEQNEMSDVGASQLGEQDFSQTTEPRQPNSKVGRGVRVPEMVVEWEQRLAA